MQNSDRSKTLTSFSSPPSERALDDQLAKILDDTIAAYQLKIQEHSLLVARKKQAAIGDQTPPLAAPDFSIRRAA